MISENELLLKSLKESYYNLLSIIATSPNESHYKRSREFYCRFGSIVQRCTEGYSKDDQEFVRTKKTMTEKDRGDMKKLIIDIDDLCNTIRSTSSYNNKPDERNAHI